VTLTDGDRSFAATDIGDFKLRVSARLVVTSSNTASMLSKIEAKAGSLRGEDGDEVDCGMEEAGCGMEEAGCGMEEAG
jgi:hypothetical protein